ncbi:penicillin acylase family protein [Streptomyces sp. L7]
MLCTSSVPGLTDLSARGPAARFVWDLARREDSLWVVPLGASGLPGSSHHRDQLPLWLKGDLVPVITDFSRLEPEPPTRRPVPRTARRRLRHRPRPASGPGGSTPRWSTAGSARNGPRSGA